MGYRSALLLAAILGTAFARVPSDEADGLPGPLTIFLEGDLQTPPDVLRAMQREVQTLVAPSGIHIRWDSIKSSGSSKVYARIAVVRLLGQCSPGAAFPARAPGTDADSLPLGQTQMTDGKVLPFADVRCDSVRRVIGQELRRTPPADREELLGRALGRVMAHELYHVLLRSKSHGRSGLARPVQSCSDLVAASDTFAEADERKLSASFQEEDNSHAAAGGR